MKAVIAVLFVTAVVALCSYVQFRLARLFGKPIGLSLSLALQAFFSAAFGSFAGALLNNLFPPYHGPGSSWPAVGEAFLYQMDVLVFLVFAFFLNVISALLIALLLKPNAHKTE